MGTITMRAIINKAQTLLHDTDKIRYPDAEMLGWGNEGQREIVKYKPEACVTHAARQMTGGTKQTLPAGAVRLIDVPRNMGSNGATPGRAIIYTPRAVLDECIPDWHTHSTSTTAKRYAYDPNDPLVYFIYPPQPAVNPGYVDEVYASAPTNCTLNGVEGGVSDSVIALADVHESDLINYIIYRALLKLSKHTGNAARAEGARQTFLQGLGLQEAGEIKVEPGREEG